MQPTKTVLPLAVVLLLLGLTPTAAADDIHCQWILGTQHCVTEPDLGGLVIHPPESTHDPVCFEFREAHWCSESPGWPLTRLTPEPLPPIGPIAPEELLDEPLPGGDEAPAPEDLLNETGVPPVPGEDDLPDPQDVLNETGVPPLPGADDLPGPDDLPGAEDLPGPGDLPDADELPVPDEVPPIEIPIGIVPDRWDGPTFPIGRCLSGQYDLAGRIICIVDTPYITVQQTLEWLGRP